MPIILSHLVKTLNEIKWTGGIISATHTEPSSPKVVIAPRRGGVVAKSVLRWRKCVTAYTVIPEGGKIQWAARSRLGTFWIPDKPFRE